MSVSIVGPFPECKQRTEVKEERTTGFKICDGTLLPKVSIDWDKTWRGKMRARPETQVLIWKCSQCGRMI